MILLFAQPVEKDVGDTVLQQEASAYMFLRQDRSTY
jgi:hypothetical protein